MNPQKKDLVESLKQKGFPNEILRAFSEIKREDFIPKDLRKYAYEDTALPIGQNQTISQPYTIAVMLSLLELKRGEIKNSSTHSPKSQMKGQKILEIGSGCGYVLALLSKIVGVKGKVFGIEIIKKLFEKSKKNIKEFKNVKIYNKNGFFGLKEKSPFDAILISAAIEKIPKLLVKQLKNNGIIVSPVGGKYEQSITSFKKIKGKLKIKKEIPGFVFVPFVKN